MLFKQKPTDKHIYFIHMIPTGKCPPVALFDEHRAIIHTLITYTACSPEIFVIIVPKAI